jgi:hypothetical protein
MKVAMSDNTLIAKRLQNVQQHDRIRATTYAQQYRTVSLQQLVHFYVGLNFTEHLEFGFLDVSLPLIIDIDDTKILKS